jgi:hypothetical protein
MLPGASAGLRLNVIAIRLPDILEEQLPGGTPTLSRRLGVAAPALAGELALRIFPGVQMAPGLGGIGGLSVLGSVAVLPFDLFDTEGFDDSDVAYGIGGRVNILDESFQVPGIALSLMRRSVSGVAFGDICAGGLTGVTGSGSPEFGECATGGDTGEFSVDLTSWSTRLVASKRLLGMGATLGVGHDSSDSESSFGFRGTNPVLESGPTPAFRVRDVELESSRFTAFANLSFTLLVASVAAEAGWVQGDSPVADFDELQSGFDPDDGSWYGSIGIRVSL